MKSLSICEDFIFGIHFLKSYARLHGAHIEIVVIYIISKGWSSRICRIQILARFHFACLSLHMTIVTNSL